MTNNCYPHRNNCRCNLCKMPGPPSLQGPTGPTGATGATGAAGTTPTVTVAGTNTGAPGTRANVDTVHTQTGVELFFTIPAGPAGEQGAQGTQGATGPRGANGTSVTILGSYDTVEALEAEHPDGEPGDSYLVDGDLYVWDEVNGAWVNVGRIRGPAGPPGLPGPQGATGPAAALIPFSLGKYGTYLGTDDLGQPQMITFAGFSPAYGATVYLQEGEWDSRTITVRDETSYPTAFIMTYAGTVRKIYVLFSINDGTTFQAGATMRPFVCLATSTTNDLVYTILPDTIVYTDPYVGGNVYPIHATRRGARAGLNVQIPENALVTIVAGIAGEGVTEAQAATFSIAGGIYLE